MSAPEKDDRIPKGEPIEFEIRDLGGMCEAVHWRQYFTDGSKDVWWTLPDRETRNLNGRAVTSLPFYNSDLIAWKLGTAGVVVTEGEKAAKALTDRGIPALATVTGSSTCPDAKVFKRTAEALGRAPVLLWPDNADDGREHMAEVAAGFRAAGLQDIKLVTWAEAPAKGDAFDYVTDKTRDEVRAFLAAAEPMPGFEPDPVGATTIIAPETDRYAPKVSKSRVWQADAFVKNVRDFEYLLDRAVAYGASMACTGPRGRGKTYLLIGLARAILQKYETYLGLTLRRRTGRVLLVLSDDAASLIKARIQVLGLAVPDLYIMSADDWSGDPLAVLSTIPDHVQAIGGVDLVGIDAKYVFIPHEANAGNDSGLTGRFVDALGTITAKTGAAVWLTDHDNRAGGIMSGSAIVQHEMLSILHLEPVGEADDFTAVDTTLTVEKQKAEPRSNWPKPMRLTQDVDGMWRVLGADRDLREQETAEDLGPILLKLLDQAKMPLNLSAIVAITKRRKDDVRAVLTSLWSAGRITRTGEGTKGKAFLYSKNAGPENAGPDPRDENAGPES